MRAWFWTKLQGVHRTTWEPVLKSTRYNSPRVKRKQAFWAQFPTGKVLPDHFSSGNSVAAHVRLHNVAPRSVEEVYTLCDEGRLHEALLAAEGVGQRGMALTVDCVICLIQGCGRKKDLGAVRRLQMIMVDQGFSSDIFLGNNLIHLFASCGALLEAKQVFRQTLDPNVYSWQAIISAHANHGQGDEAIRLFQEMLCSDVKPNNHVYVAVLKACAVSGGLASGRWIHSYMVESGFQSNTYVGNTVIDMYAKCGSTDEARKVFDGLSPRNLVSWNAMIAGYVNSGQGQAALDLFQKMRAEDIQPDKSTFSSIFKACGNLVAIDQGRQIHSEFTENGLPLGVVVGNTLIDMYVRCGKLEEARRVFDALEARDVISWNAMIAGYAQDGHALEALECFGQMEQEGVVPNKVTFISLLKACGNIAALGQGRKIHAQLVEAGLDADVVVGTSLVHMYARCGNLDEAYGVFEKLTERSVVSWNAVIGAYAQHGFGREALQLFEQMQQQGFKPDDITLVSVLSACSHAGLLEQGYQLFKSMLKDFSIKPGMYHHACMVDMLSRAGHLQQAEDFIKQMPFEPDVDIWMTVLGACQAFGDVELGRRAFESIIRLQPLNEAAYVQMSNILAAAGRPDDAAELRKDMRDAGMLKSPGRTWIEVDDQMHSFLVEDKDHSLRQEIYAKLRQLAPLVEAEMRNRVLAEDSCSDTEPKGTQYADQGVSSTNSISVREPLCSFSSAEDVSNLCEQGRLQEALQIVRGRIQQDMPISKLLLFNLLQFCIKAKDVATGRLVHTLIREKGLDSDVFFGNNLIRLFSSGGCLSEARQIFLGITSPNVYTWQAIISAHAKHGQGSEAIKLYQQMQISCVVPNTYVYVAALKACASLGALKQGRWIHAHVLEAGLQANVFVGNTLIDMYAKCGCLEEAKRVFDNLAAKDVVSWNTMIAGYAQHGHGEEAFGLFQKMQHARMTPDRATLSSIEKACRHLTSLVPSTS